MIKKYIIIGAIGTGIVGTSLSGLEITQTKAATNEIEKIDNSFQEKKLNLTGYVVGIHKNSNRIEVADVETKEEAIEFSEKRKDFINLLSQNKFLLFENKANQKYKVGEQIRVSANKTEKIGPFLTNAIDPVVTKLTDEN